jgi:signal peptidase II
VNTKLKIIFIILGVLLIDQALKIYIKTHFHYGEDMPLFGASWAYFNFVENNGMAFGLSLGGEYGKLLLSLFRIVAVILLWKYIIRLINQQAHFGLLLSFALIFAGAVGNIIDSAFYGMIFSESKYHGEIATMFPPGGGYSSFLHGKVVDMFYFPLIDTYLPDWFPIWGGEHFEFFRPVFNIADASISVGVGILLVFYKKFFQEHEKSEPVGVQKMPESEA